MCKTVAIVAATPLTVNFFLQDQVKALSDNYKVSIIVNAAKPEELGCLAEVAEFIPVKIRREISVFADIVAMWHLYQLFCSRRFDIVHSFTPKAGLLSMVASWMAGIDFRLHTFTGQVWATRQGVGRWLLKKIDTITARMASIVLVDSHSQREFLIQNGVVSESGSRVLADGSISGVNLDRFHPDLKQRDQVRHELGISDTAKVILYLGRLKRDKGVLDLGKAFLGIHDQVPETVLLVVGPDEDDLLPVLKGSLGESSDRFVYVPYTRMPEYFMRAADILCLPSYREGFGSVVIEAAACEIPSVVSRIYGLTDAVVDGETGLLVTAADVPELAKAVIRLASDDDLRTKQGMAARRRAEELFSERKITQELLRLYTQLFCENDVHV